MGFSVTYPLILPVGAFFFAFRYFTAKYNLLCFYHPVKHTTGNVVTRAVTASLLVGILIFQMLTCIIVLHHSTTLYFVFSVILLVLSSATFLLIYVNRFKLEVMLKKKFQEEPNIDKSFMLPSNLSLYSHPLDI